MISSMARVVDAFWRAAAYCLHPRVIAMSFLPLLFTAGLAWGLGYFFWEPANDAVRATLDSWKLIDSLLGYLNFIGANDFRAVLTPLIVLILATPLLMIASLLLVAFMMTPALVRMVAARRFATLERRSGSFTRVQGVFWALGHCLIALVLLIVSLPFWLIPPLVLILPPLIWGWLGYRLFSFDVLADHASADERRTLLRQHRAPLLMMGIVTGYLGAAPAALWSGSALHIAFALFLMPVALWLFMLVFAFSTLWFTHYALASLAVLRGQVVPVADSPPPPLTQEIAPSPVLPPTL